ncbi:hypothetical protein PFY10_01360 [Chryseobacterium daecheongense]|nr:hypothetical protein PFY10_01360 [Chryseobacterium daecheongense]
MKKFFRPLLLISMFMISFSCNDDSQSTENNSVSALHSNLSNKAGDCGLVTEGDDQKWEAIDPVEVAILHNKFLEVAVNTALQNPGKSDIEILTSLDIPNVSSDYMNCISTRISNTSDDEMDKVIMSNLSDDRAVGLYNEILDDLSGDNKSFSTISKEMDDTRLKINSLSNQKDRDILLTCLETGLASSKFWLPTELEGDGVGYHYLSVVNSTSKVGGDTRFKKDMRGAGYGMVAWSFSAFLGPVGASGLVYGAVTGAIGSSFLP